MLSQKPCDQQVQAYLTEYEQAWQGFRHVYETAWQVFAAIAAISTALLVLSYVVDGQVRSAAQLAASIVILFWALGMYLPMHHYGDQRAKRAEEIETALQCLGIHMKLAHEYRSRADTLLWKALQVRWLVALLGLLSLVVVVVSIYGLTNDRLAPEQEAYCHLHPSELIETAEALGITGRAIDDGYAFEDSDFTRACRATHGLRDSSGSSSANSR